MSDSAVEVKNSVELPAFNGMISNEHDGMLREHIKQVNSSDNENIEVS